MRAGEEPQVSNSLARDYYESSLVERMRGEGFKLKIQSFTFYLAEEFGFCYGVDNAVTTAFRTRSENPDKKIFLTNEIIHNPRVNQELREAGIQFLDASKKYGELKKGDIVILPAFGISVPELRALKKTGCILVDTACGSVVAVWKRVEKYAKDGFTSLIHGKFDHEETRATCSQVVPFEGHYIVIRDIKEAEVVAKFIENGVGAQELKEQFKKAISSGFDPQKHLVKVGCANQTTMLSSDSLKIAERIEKAFIKKYGKESLSGHFMKFDTICSATQDRQDAVEKLIQNQNMDLILVIGGFNSSNTSHLLEIAAAKLPAFHISEAGDLISINEIKCKQVDEKEPKIIKDWFPASAKNIGITAGASTPNRVIEDVIRRFLEIKNLRIVDSN